MRTLSIAVGVVLVCGAALAKKPDKAKEDPVPLVNQFVQCAVSGDAACLEKATAALEGKKGACGLLSEELRGAEPEVARRMAPALATLECEEVMEAVVELLGLSECEVRPELALAFAPTKDRRLLDPLMRLTEKGRPYEREKGCAALALLGMKEALPVLLKAATEQFFAIRVEAAKALGSFPSKETTVALCGMVTGDANAGVKVAAAGSLAKLKDVESVPCLSRGLDDAVGDVISASHEALVAVTGMDLGLSALAWEQWYQKQSTSKTNKK